VNPRTLDALILLRGLVSTSPISLGVPPQSGKSARQPGWRLGRGDGFMKVVQDHSEISRCRFPYCELPNDNFATQETTMTEPAKKERAESEAVKQKSTMLTAQLLWAAHAWNATPEEAAQQVVADLYEHLSRGGTVSVRVEGLEGTRHTLEARAKR
jgi:hypothetical protein